LGSAYGREVRLVDAGGASGALHPGRDVEILGPPSCPERKPFDALRRADEDELRAWIEPDDRRYLQGLPKQAEKALHFFADSRADRLGADQPDERDVDDLRDLLGDGCEELLRRRLVRDEGRNATQGGLLIGELAQMALGLFRRRDIAQRSADQDRLSLDLAQR